MLLGEGQSIGWQMRYEVVVVVAILVGLPVEMPTNKYTAILVK